MDPAPDLRPLREMQDTYYLSKTPSKSRSFSDPPATNTPTPLQPSPTFLEKVSPHSKDDHALPSENGPTTPKASRRPGILARGLSLQMPPRLDMPSPSHFPRPAPLSPQLDQHNIYMQQPQSLLASPATSLPRHSRGLDFARACTTLHHSTLAESSPDSSPVITQKGMMIPGRKGSMSSMVLDSPNLFGPSSMPWGAERSAISSSVGSVNMLASESSSAESDEDASMAGDDTEDPIYTTPQVHKLQNPNTASTPFDAPSTPGPPGMWGNGNIFSPAQNSLMKTIRRSRLQKSTKRNRKSSSSASGSGYSSMNSPRTTSPPPTRSIETAASNGYFPLPATAARSRRESLALGTDKLHLSSGNDSGDEASHSGTPSTPNVVRRPVTRRHNLLPKTKGMARIRAALAEEAAPVETESRREAETIRQVRERDGSIAELDLTSGRPQTATGQSSPSLLPAVPELAQEDFGGELDRSDPSSSGMKKAHGLGVNFAAHVNRNSAGADYWNRFDPSTVRTPPPPNFHRNSSSAMSDINIDSDTPPTLRRPRGRSTASDASEVFVPASSAGINTTSSVHDDMHLKKFKRRREDDFDIATIKRRAVSPGMSAQNSPVLTQSPNQREWGGPPERKDKSQTSVSGESSQAGQPPSRHGSGGSSVSVSSGTNTGAKKLGLQGMVDTNDGLMKMSIES